MGDMTVDVPVGAQNATGDVVSRKARLEWLRDVLEGSIGDADPANRAALAKQYRDTLSELESMHEPEVSVLDDLAAARKSRLSTSVSAGKRNGKQRRARGD